jgi:hypothetical protein
MPKILNAENFKEYFGLNSSTFSDSRKLLGKYFNKLKIDKKFKNILNSWILDFGNIYKLRYLTEDLFMKHLYIHSICRNILKFNINYWKDFHNIFLGDKKYFRLDIGELDDYLLKKIKEFKIDQSDLFMGIYQELIASSIRHSIGEFYTPPNLANSMIKEVYNIGDKVLDPACGSGIFLIETIKKILHSNIKNNDKVRAINNIYGIDINPIAVLITKINLLLLTYDLNGIDLVNNIFLENSLDINNKDLLTKIKKVDLIIGNPPWLVYRDLESENYQNLIKKIAEKNKIKPEAKDISNLEISTLFFYEIPRIFLKDGGKIFLIMTNNVLNGSQSQKFRNFNGFTDLELWDFQNRIFNIQNIALKAKYHKNYDDIKSGNQNSENPYPLNVKLFNDKSDIIDEYKLVPSYIEGQNVKKLIKKEDKSKLMQIKRSNYYKDVHKGADLFPRTLLFVNTIEKNDDLVIINRDFDATSRSKKAWNDTVFKDVEIEKNYVFEAVKANLLVPFNILGTYEVVLPIDRNYQKILNKNLKYNMRKFYQKIDKIYKERKKSTTKFECLWENVNYRNKLIKQDPMLFKVVFNEAGSKLKSAVVGKNIIIDYTLLYYQTPDIDECYYLSAILNSDFLNENLKLIKSSRHFVKRPFKFNIPKYDSSNEKHVELCKIAKDCEKSTKNIQDKEIINARIKQSLLKIDKIIKNIL